MFLATWGKAGPDLVLADLGLFSYERVEFSPESRALRCRAILKVTCTFTPVASSLSSTAMPRPCCNRCWTTRRIFAGLRVRCFSSASIWSGQSWTGHCSCTSTASTEARQRSIRVLERQELYQAAVSLAQVAQQGPVSDAEHQHLLRIIPRLRRKLGLAAWRWSNRQPRIASTCACHGTLPAAWSSRWWRIFILARHRCIMWRIP